MVIPYRGKLEELFIMVRDETRKGIGTVYIHSPELAIRFKELFEEKWKRAIDMRSPKAKAVYSKLERDLELTYSKYHLKK
jgi:DNA-binding transcriptional regulator GbsR (MarR family)